MFRLALGVLCGYTQGRASSGWFRGLGCSLGRAGPAVWRVLSTASFMLTRVGLCVEASQVFWVCCSWLLRLAGVLLQRSVALLGVIADSEYVDNMGYSGRQYYMPTLVGLV